MQNVLQAFTGAMGLRANFGGSPQRGNGRYPLMEENSRFAIQEPGQQMSQSPMRLDAHQSPGPNNMYMTMALGACTALNCPCPIYVRPDNQALIRCEACDHAPLSHSRVN